MSFAAILYLFYDEEYPLLLCLGFVALCIVLYWLTGMFEWIKSCFKRK